MLGLFFILLFQISPIQSCLQEDNDGNQNIFHIPNGEPFYIKCPYEPRSSEPQSPELLSSEQNYTITWFKTSSETDISTDIHTRIHQDNNLLKFIPAKLEDSGSYLCRIRTEKGCWQKALSVDVFQNDNGLCYKKEALYDNRPIFGTTMEIQCPYVVDYVDKATAEFIWFKDCKALDLTNKKYFLSNDMLIITDGTTDDAGKYTCVTSFIHNGTEYNISRSMGFEAKARPLKSTPVILYPTNNFIDAELGAHVIVTCQALVSSKVQYFAWMYNDSFISDYFNDSRVMEGEQYEKMDGNGKNITCQDLIFSSVKEDDYDFPFFCYAFTTSEDSMAFFRLKRQGPNYQRVLIAFFVAAVFLVVSTIIIIKVFKVDLVLWYRNSCFYSPQENDGKKYDAYIMYPRNAIGHCTYDMDLFVLKLLPEVLEKPCAYQLFIIGRDDLPGQALADVVDEAISQSRRLIIVLGQVSNKINLGEDFEQKIGMYDALIRNEIKVILIEMEKITDYTVMPESINYIKQKQGVVRWKETFTEASLSPNTRFWKNIRYRMPPAPRHSDRDLDIVCTEDLLHEHDSL